MDALDVALEGLSLMKTLRDRRRKPTHPGAILREDVLPALRMSQGELASRLGVSRVTVNTLLQEKRDLSIELAAHGTALREAFDALEVFDQSRSAVGACLRPEVK